MHEPAGHLLRRQHCLKDAGRVGPLLEGHAVVEQPASQRPPCLLRRALEAGLLGQEEDARIGEGVESLEEEHQVRRLALEGAAIRQLAERLDTPCHGLVEESSASDDDDPLPVFVLGRLRRRLLAVRRRRRLGLFLGSWVRRGAARHRVGCRLVEQVAIVRLQRQRRWPALKG